MQNSIIKLPLDIIDNIITANSNKIITTYHKLTSSCIIAKNNTKHNNKKRKIEKQNHILEYLYENQLTYYNKSTLLSYFLTNNINNTSNISNISNNRNFIINNKFNN
jgi:hypothetical protein